MRSKLARVIGMLALGLTSPAHAEAPPEEGMLGDFGVGLRFSYLHGGADGQLQTPLGGRPGTSSDNRPKLDEIDADDVNAYDGALDLSWRGHHLDVGGQWLTLDGSDDLGSTLVSRGVTFPAGSHVSSDVRLNWYRAGYRYRFDLPLGGDQHLYLSPGVQGVYLDYDYDLDGAGGLSASRSYPQGGMRLGGVIEWRPHRIFALEASGWWGVPIEETARIHEAALLAKVRVLHFDRGPSTWLHVGVGYEHIEFRDDQEMVNDIDVEMAPLLNVGIELRL